MFGLTLFFEPLVHVEKATFILKSFSRIIFDPVSPFKEKKTKKKNVSSEILEY